MGNRRKKCSKSDSGKQSESLVKTVSKKLSYFEIPVIRRQQKDVFSFSGEMDLSTLDIISQVDSYDSSNPEKLTSCQRIQMDKAAEAFAKFIVKFGNVCLGELMLNDRFGMLEFTSLKDMGIQIPSNGKAEAVFGILRVPMDAITYVYDGGTRRLGYLSLLHDDYKLIETDVYKGYKNLNVPFCISQVSALDETRFFLNHNGKQTKVSSDHRAIVTFHANKNGRVITNCTKDDYIKSIASGACFYMVKDRTNPWHRNIKMSDSPKDAKKIVTSGAFSHGLKKLLAWMDKEYWSPETNDGEKAQDTADICTIYWRAVRRVCPKIFKNVDNYIMSTSQGVSSLSLLMGLLYKDFFSADTTWNISNVAKELKKSSLLTSPFKWEKNGEIATKRSGNYKGLEQLCNDIYFQIKNG